VEPIIFQYFTEHVEPTLFKKGSPTFFQLFSENVGSFFFQKLLKMKKMLGHLLQLWQLAMEALWW
jgi:hypothetical protein